MLRQTLTVLVLAGLAGPVLAQETRASASAKFKAEFAASDTNKDGVLSLVEHRAGKLAYFDQIDTDKDGVVSVAEMKAAGVMK